MQKQLIMEKVKEKLFTNGSVDFGSLYVAINMEKSITRDELRNILKQMVDELEITYSNVSGVKIYELA